MLVYQRVFVGDETSLFCHGFVHYYSCYWVWLMRVTSSLALF